MAILKARKKAAEVGAVFVFPGSGKSGHIEEPKKGVIRVMGLIGCDVVFVETVGVGQSEVEVAGVADVVLIVLAPGQGDSVQLLKAGLMEIGDLFVVNKADRPEAARLHGDLIAMLRMAHGDDTGHHVARLPDEPGDTLSPLLAHRPGSAIEPETCLVSAEQGQGVPALMDRLDELANLLGPAWQRQRQDTIERDVQDAVLEEATRRLRETLRRTDGDGHTARAILNADLSVEDAARRLLSETR